MSSSRVTIYTDTAHAVCGFLLTDARPRMTSSHTKHKFSDQDQVMGAVSMYVVLVEAHSSHSKAAMYPSITGHDFLLWSLTTVVMTLRHVCVCVCAIQRQVKK